MRSFPPAMLVFLAVRMRSGFPSVPRSGERGGIGTMDEITMLTRDERTHPSYRSSEHEHHRPGPGIRPSKRSFVVRPAILLGYTVAVLMTAIGAGVLFGLLLDEGVPEKFRIMFGIVLTLMGVYRFAVTRTRVLQERREEMTP